jgi:lipopolysaccharide transport system ATP-binding protein
MSDIAIRVEDLGKLYRLGEIGTGTISHDLNRWWARVRGKEDPFAKIGETNDRTTRGKTNYVWALKDVNFEVKQGEVLGIIGRNGAGKSTLLKILSKVTTPSTGRIKVKGRIASLLEVGTGFHPELTGRENIFLNGAILGMTKWEIKSKFDEIVDFAGVERYIDTPVKRYSSGMYVRLAFAVAAFLEPEILIVDEVLAVGDAEFQKKCLGRMKDVSVNDGRTVLFVSHQMPAIEALCTTGVLLANGMLKKFGSVNDVISIYNSNQLVDSSFDLKSRNRRGDGEVMFLSYEFLHNVSAGGIFQVDFKIEATKKFSSAEFAFIIKNSSGRILTTLFTKQDDEKLSIEIGLNNIRCTIQKFPFASGLYNIDLWCSSRMDIESDYIQDAFQLEVLPANFYGNGYSPTPQIHGEMLVINKWYKVDE